MHSWSACSCVGSESKGMMWFHPDEAFYFLVKIILNIKWWNYKKN